VLGTVGLRWLVLGGGVEDPLECTVPRGKAEVVVTSDVDPGLGRDVKVSKIIEMFYVLLL